MVSRPDGFQKSKRFFVQVKVEYTVLSNANSGFNFTKTVSKEWTSIASVNWTEFSLLLS